MAVKLNPKGNSNAKALIKAGKVDKDSSWSMSADDENKIMGDPPDWTEYAKWFLGVDTDAANDTKDHYKYPFGKDDKVYRAALVAIRVRASQQGATAIYDAAGELIKKIDGTDKALIAEEQRDINNLPPQKRTVDIEVRAMDGEAGVYELTFSSETPIERWWGLEILDHSSASVQLERLKKTGAVLINHDTDQMVGRVLDASISGKKGRAKIEFSPSNFAQEKKREVDAGFWRSTSVSYAINKMVLESDNNGVQSYRVNDWEPLEISLVSVPADTSVGVGRTIINSTTKPIIKKEERIMEKCTKCGAELVNGSCPACAAKVAAENARAEIERAEYERVSEIMAIGQKHGLLDEALTHVRDKKSADEFRKIVIDKISNAKKPVIQSQELPPDKPFRTFGDFLLAVADAAKPERGVDPRLNSIRAAAGAAEAVPSDGGFLVQADFTLSLLDRLNQTGILYPKCRHIPIGPNSNGLTAPIVDETSRATGSRWGGVQIYRTAEGGAPTAQKPRFAMLELQLAKLMGVAYATDELLRDSSALEAIIMQAFTEEFGFIVDDEIIRGSGAGQMLGLLNAPALVSVAKESGQPGGTFVAENVTKMFARMWVRGVTNATWYINQEVWPQIFQLSIAVGAGGVPMFFPPGGMTQAPYGLLLGRPVQPIEQCSALGTVGDVIFADLNQYVVIEKDALNAAQSLHVRFLTDEMTYRFTMRNNGCPLWKNFITPYRGASTISPFVALATRA